LRRDLLHYDLPDELVARHPPDARDGGRLLVVDPREDLLEHAAVRDFDRYVAAGALLVVNDTQVVPARLYGTKESSGGKVELLLIERLEGEVATYRAMGRASKPLREGQAIAIEGGELTATIVQKHPSGGLVDVALAAEPGVDLEAALDRAGHVPLPPYLGRGDEPADRARYQTVYAREKGAIAAPTAGLHLSHDLLARLEARGVRRTSVTLHVGLGTFQPVTADDLDDHAMHTERFVVSAETRDAIADARARNAPVVAVGTTVVRALESAADTDRIGHVVTTAPASTRLLIQPGYRFRVVDQLLTNFHLPESTLLALVAAFAGRERVLAAYRSAVEARYRFFSYGDAMFIRTRSDGDEGFRQ
jgi:S-adenosylmethionine:tRNA ribosyltransferase-isomerase